MTRGIWKFTVDQDRVENLTITNLPSSKMIVIVQRSGSRILQTEEQKIFVNADNLDDLIDALRSAKRWSK